MKHIATLSLGLLLGTVVHAQVFQDHTRVRRLDSSALPQFQNATVCPSGSVLSGGVCTPLIQNQGGMTAHWAKAFAGETKCTPSPVSYLVRGESSGDGVGYYYNRYWATRCVTIRSDGSFYVTAGSYSNTIRLNELSSPDQHVNTNIDLPWGTGTILSYVAPIYDRWSGGAISSWAVYGVSQ